MKQAANFAEAGRTDDRSSDAAPISARNVTVSYDARPALRSVSFDLEPGTITGIIGPNGAGKSTLLKAILGLISLDAGRITVFGSSISAARHHVAYVPQKQSVDWEFPVTVLDVVMMGRFGRLSFFGRLFSRPNGYDIQRALEALETVGMQDFVGRHIRHLSGGQQQRVFLARALCQDANVLLLDEPFGGVDAATESVIFSLIDGLAKRGKTLLIVNHDLSILEHFDSVLLLNQRVIAFGPTQNTATTENLRKTYGGRLSLLERADDVLQDMR